MGPLRFELKLLAPRARVLDQATLRPPKKKMGLGRFELPSTAFLDSLVRDSFDFSEGSPKAAMLDQATP